MIQVDVPMAFAAGSILAGAARHHLATGTRADERRAQRLVNLYFLIGLGWVPIYFLWFYFGWETSHLWWHADSAGAYPGFAPLLWVTLGLLINAGFIVGCRLIQRGYAGRNRALYVVLLIYCVAWVVGAGDRVLRLGTYTEFQVGRAPLFTHDRAFVTALVITMTWWIGGLVACSLVLLREGERRSAGARR